MFQDEARFGRMVRIRRCWAEKPMRPTVCNGYEREFLYVYGAVRELVSIKLTHGCQFWVSSKEAGGIRLREVWKRVWL